MPGELLSLETHAPPELAPTIAAEAADEVPLMHEAICPLSKAFLEMGTLSFTVGKKRVAILPIDFSDAPGAIANAAQLDEILKGANELFVENSYGKASLEFTVLPLARVAETRAFYETQPEGQREDILLDAAQTAAQISAQNGFDSMVILTAQMVGTNWSVAAHRFNGGWKMGRMYMNGPNSLTGYYLAHELGHSFGLQHARGWLASSDTIVGKSGSPVEYGSPFDLMGLANYGRQMSANYRVQMGWLNKERVQTICASGKFRLHGLESAREEGVQALRILRPDSATSYTDRAYWIEFQPRLSEATQKSAIVYSAGNQGGSMLYDMTPWTNQINASAHAFADAPLALGRTFVDDAAKIYVTPVGQADADSLDIVVNMNMGRTNNVAPEIPTLSASAATPGQVVTVTAQSIDADGDVLAYDWQIDGKSVGQNSPQLAYTWKSPGEHVVRCVVSDMKGGLASSDVIVSVGTSTAHRLEGLITVEGKPAHNVRVAAAALGEPLRFAFTGSDGRYHFAGLSSASYAVSAVAPGSAFAEPQLVDVTAVPKVDLNGTRVGFPIRGYIPLPGVPVSATIGVQTVTTDANGFFAFENVPNGFYTVQASAPGYKIAVQLGSPSVEMNYAEVRLSFSATPN